MNSAYVNERRLLFCPADETLRTQGTGSSYVFRAVVPPGFVPYWQLPVLPPTMVWLNCRHHLEQKRIVRGDSTELSPPAYPYQLVLRVGGAVERVRWEQIREIALPGREARFMSSYPGEPWYVTREATDG